MTGTAVGPLVVHLVIFVGEYFGEAPALGASLFVPVPTLEALELGLEEEWWSVWQA